MKSNLFLICLLAGVACGQTTLTWNSPAINTAALTSEQNVAGVFFVANFHANGTHTDYDIARQAADAYAAANPDTGSLLVLRPTVNQTCDAVPLPALGTGRGLYGTTSIFGFGSGLSSIQKRNECPASVATVSHPDAPGGGQLSHGWYQGFTVDANHIDPAACEMFGMSATTFLDVSCGNAAIGADHELQFGNRDPNLSGWMPQIYIYNLKTFDTVGAGKGAILTPAWSGGSLAGVTVTNQGTKKYTQQFTRAKLIGPDLATCSSVPTLAPGVSNTGAANFENVGMIQYGYLTGASITNPGNCTSTSRIYILIQDGVPVTYGMKFSNMAYSYVWNLEPTGSAQYGIAWLRGSDLNKIYGEHPYANQTVQITDQAGGNRHINAFFDSPGAFGAEITSTTGTFENAIFSWDSPSYLGSSGYNFSYIPRWYQDWKISNSSCSSTASDFNTISTQSGPWPDTADAPNGIILQNVEDCDGSNIVNWPVPSN